MGKETKASETPAPGAGSPAAEELKALVAEKEKENAGLREELKKALTQRDEAIVMIKGRDEEVKAAEGVIEDLKNKLAEYEAAPAVDGKGRKVHKLAGTKKQYRLLFPVKLGDVLVNDDEIAADAGLLKKLVEMESGAIEEV